MSNQYDGDISNCSETDLNASSHDDLRHNCSSSNDENDADIGRYSDIDHCLDDEARDSGTSEDKEVESKYLTTPKTKSDRPISPYSMDSWINYSSDEFSSQDLIVRKGTKLNLHDDESTIQDTEDVDVYDKINFVNAKSMMSYKKSKMAQEDEMVKPLCSTNPFKFSAMIRENNLATAKLAAETESENGSSVEMENSDIRNGVASHDTDDGIEVGLEEEEDDDQLSSLSSNIDTIIVSETGETKYFNASGEEHEDHPTLKKKKSTNADDGEDNKLQMNTTSTTSMMTTKVNHSKLSTPLVDVRIIDFAHTTFTTTDNDFTASMKDKGLMLNAGKKVHHGPDGGFLTGIESLKRILSEILTENSR